MKIILLFCTLISFTLFSQEKKSNSQLGDDINTFLKKEKGFQLRMSPGISYFGNSIKTHWDISCGFISKKGNGISLGLEGVFDSQSLDKNTSTYDQQSAFINLEFLTSEIWNNDATKHALSFGWLIKDDANIFHKGGNVDCFRIMFGTTLAKQLFFYGAIYFDKDDSTGERHDLPAIGFRYGW